MVVIMRIQPIRSWKYCRKSPFEATIVELFSGQTRFSSEFPVNSTRFFFLPFSPVSLTELCSFCYGLKDLFPMIDDLIVVALDRSKLMMSQAVEETDSCGGSAVNEITANKKWAKCFKLCLLTSLDKNEL